MSIEGLSQCTLNNNKIQSNSGVQMSFENTLVIHVLLPPLYKPNWKRKTAVDRFFS